MTNSKNKSFGVIQNNTALKQYIRSKFSCQRFEVIQNNTALKQSYGWLDEV